LHAEFPKVHDKSKLAGGLKGNLKEMEKHNHGSLNLREKEKLEKRG